MLYPLLHWDTRFPAGYTGETVDLLMMDAAARTLRGASEVRLELNSTQLTQQSGHIVEQVVGWRYFWKYLLHRSVFC